MARSMVRWQISSRNVVTVDRFYACYFRMPVAGISQTALGRFIGGILGTDPNFLYFRNSGSIPQNSRPYGALAIPSRTLSNVYVELGESDGAMLFRCAVLCSSARTSSERQLTCC